MKRIKWGVILFFISVLSYGQMLPIPDQKLVSTSENIVRGTVLSSTAQWVNNNKYIYTFTKVLVSEVFSGNCKVGDTITIVAPGGYDPVKDMGMGVSHQVAFEINDDAILFTVEAKGNIDAIDYTFLKNEPSVPDNLLRMNGYFQGKREIFHDKKTGKTMIKKPNDQSIVELNSHNQQLTKSIDALKKKKF